MPNKYRQIPPLQRFLAKVEKTDTCWLWTGATFDNGYGAFRDGNQRQSRAHRWSYENFVGPIPEGLVIRHRCDVRRCVNPAHLTPGTHQENQQDMLERGRLGKRPETSRLNRRKAAKLSVELAAEIRQRYASGEGTYRSLGREYGVGNATIQAIVEGRTWRD